MGLKILLLNTIKYIYNTSMLVYEFKLKGKLHQYYAIDEAIRVVQFIRNKSLRHWMDNQGANRYELSKLAASLPKEFLFANNLNATARQQATERAWLAISRFYGNCKRKIPGKKGYPRFQKHNRSVEYKKSGWKLLDDCKRILFTDRCGIGTLKLIGKQHLNQLKKQIQRVRIIKRADGYYAQFAINVDRNETVVPTDSFVGLDMGLTALWTDSNGNKQAPLKALIKSEKAVKRSQRTVSKCIKGSNNRKKAIKILAKKHLKIQRQRKDFAVKSARVLYQSHDLVVIEDLQVRNMVKNHKLAKSIIDASWYQLRMWLVYYSKVWSKVLVVVPANYTSQDCSSCGKRQSKELKERVHYCDCGLILDRDHNAALNILHKGLALIGTVGHTGTKYLQDTKTPVESRTAA